MDLLERTALIGEIASLKRRKLGKTALMKLLHLLQEGRSVPLGYRFTLYNYGPYDTEVMSDIEFAESLGRVTVTYLGTDQGYEIQATGVPGALRPELLEPLSVLMGHFGDLNARDLELRSTLLYLSRDFADSDLVRRLRELKPKYSEDEVQAGLNDLRSKKYIDR
jgi:uncharacterized protein